VTPLAVDTRIVRHHFSCHAEEYDRYAVVQKRVARNLMEHIDKDERIEGPVLDVGTGTGEVARLLRRSCPELPIVLTDIAHGMTLHAVADVAKAVGVDADAQALPFRDESFGLVVSSSVYQWMNDLEGAFAESWRLLKPGGLFVFALYGEQTFFELKESHRLALAETGSVRSSHVQEFPSADAVRQGLCATSFDGISVETFLEVEHHSDPADFLRNLKRIGAQNASDDRPKGLASRREIQRMIEIYRERFGSCGVIPATYEVIYGSGRKP